MYSGHSCVPVAGEYERWNGWSCNLHGTSLGTYRNIHLSEGSGSLKSTGTKQCCCPVVWWWQLAWKLCCREIKTASYIQASHPNTQHRSFSMDQIKHAWPQRWALRKQRLQSSKQNRMFFNTCRVKKREPLKANGVKAIS